MKFFEAIAFSTNLEREQYISVLQLIEMVKHRNGVGIEKAVEFLGITHVANLCVYSCQRTFEKDFDYQSIGVNQKLGSEIYGIACFEDIIKSDRSYQGKYENALDKLNKQYFKRLDLLSLELIVENTDIVTCGDRLVLQRMYSDIIQRNNNVFLALPQKARNAILEFLEPKNQNNDYVRSITQQLADEKKKVAQLIAEREYVQPIGSFSMGTPTVEHGEPKTYEQLVEALTAANNKIKQQERDIEKLDEQLNKKADTSDILNDRTEKSYQTTIGLLLELMTVAKIKGDRPPFTSEAVIIGKIADQSIYGQGKTTLETRFKDVKTTLEQVRKKAFKP